MSINILDSKIYNRIAAGEVIERPRSVVKELVENSIDAGAKHITLQIKEGGIEYISVNDDGCGLDSEDIKKAFLPHATSKISSLEDLNSITTLGFRGEALASIASVAEVEMISRQRGFDLGSKVLYDNGELIDEGACGCPEGTVITVKKLFDKIPARKKFLAKPSAEEHEITTLVAKLILSNPEISFKYIVDDEIVFISNGKGIKEAIYSVYGHEFFNGLIDIENTFPDVSIYGYIGKPGFAKHNRNWQSLIVNGRYVINTEISYIIQNYYSEYLMTRQFPVYVIYITLPPDMLDVNIHPNKMEIKFADMTRIKQVLSGAIKNTLAKKSAEPTDIIINKVFGNNDTVKAENPTKITEKHSFNASDISNTIPATTLPTTNNQKKSTSFKESLFGSFITMEPKNNTFQQQAQTARQQTQSADSLKQINSTIQDTFFTDKSFKLIGTLFRTYILIEKDDNLYFIDQHAAHERFLFDNLILHYDNIRGSQKLLFPYIFETSYDEAEKLKSTIDVIEKLGFEISETKQFHFAISAIPSILSELNLNEFVAALIESVKQEKTLKNTDLMKNTIAEIACKSAIKGNYSLSRDEISILMEDVEKSTILQCPHGRPYVIKFSRYEVEKWFKRK